jgi:hypothetical protein
MGFELIIAFIEHLKLVTTNNYNILTDIDTVYATKITVYKKSSFFH